MSNEEGLSIKKSTAISSYFSNRRFSGALSQSVEILLRDYDQCCMQHQLTRQQRAEFFVNVLSEEARTFFLLTVRKGMTFDDICEFMLKEYNSKARQLQVRRSIQPLLMDPFMVENQIASPSVAHTKMVDDVNRLTPQCHPSFRDVDHKISYLRSAILGKIWSASAINKVDSGGVSWRQFVTDIHDTISIEAEVASANTNSTHIGQYAVDPRLLKPSATCTTLTFKEARRKGVCRICNDKWAPGHKCNRARMRQATFERLRRRKNHTHIISDFKSALESATDIIVTENIDDVMDSVKNFHVEQDISNVKADLGDEDSFDDSAEQEHLTHFLSNAFSPTPSITNNCVDFC